MYSILRKTLPQLKVVSRMTELAAVILTNDVEKQPELIRPCFLSHFYALVNCHSSIRLVTNRLRRVLVLHF